MDEDRFRNGEPRRVINTSKSIRSRPGMPEDPPLFNPGPDEIEENDDAYDRKGNDDFGSNAFPEPEISALHVVQLDPACERFEITVRGKKTNGHPFGAAMVHNGKFTLADLGKMLAVATAVRHGD